MSGFFLSVLRLPIMVADLLVVGKVSTLQMLAWWVSDITVEIDGKKQENTKQKYREILEAGMKILRPNRQGLYFAIATYITLQTAKSLLLSKFEFFLYTNKDFKFGGLCDLLIFFSFKDENPDV